MPLKRSAAVLAAALLVSPLLSTPAQAAAGFFCLNGTAVQAGGEYSIRSETCTGSGIYDVPVFIFSGRSKGNYLCSRATIYPLSGEFDAIGCVLR